MKMYQCFQDDQNVYFELEPVLGCTLMSQIIEANKTVQFNACFYTAELILALEHLHGYGIIYRNLRPENIILANKRLGGIMLVGLNSAKVLRDGERTFTSCGTPVYMAPEQVTGNGHDHRVDIWNLAVLLCELISGKTPFEASSTKLVYERIVTGQVSFNWSVSAITLISARSLLMSIFHSDLSSRPTLEEIKNHRFFRSVDFDKLVHGKVEAPWFPSDSRAYV